MRKLIDGVQRIYSLPGALELDALGLAVLDITCLEVGLGFVQGHVKLSGAGAIDIPVLVAEFRLVDDSGTMNFRCSSCDEKTTIFVSYIKLERELPSISSVRMLIDWVRVVVKRRVEVFWPSRCMLMVDMDIVSALPPVG